MSKIVCEICGTSYDTTEGSCPVCGWNQSGNLDASAAGTTSGLLEEDLQFEKTVSDSTATTPVRRGKAVFDYDTVNGRRPAPKTPAPADDDDDEDDDDEEEESGSNTFLVVILVILILALLAVSAYIGWTKILKPKQMGSEDNKPQETYSQIVETTTEAATEPEVTEETDPTIPCTGLSFVTSMDTLTYAGQYWRLMVKYEPEDTTDKVTYTSEDPNVVTIDENGRVTAIGEGRTNIIVACGDKRISTEAVVDFGTEETVAPTTAEETQPEGGTTTSGGTSSTTTLKLNKSDVTIGRKGVYITLEVEGGISAESVEWRTSDSSVATVYNGNVTAIGKGVCVITAKYNGQTAECVVRCNF